MNWIKKIYYIIFYKKTGDKVMGAITGCEGYNSYQTSLLIKQKKDLIITDKIIQTLDVEIKCQAEKGEFAASYYFYSKNISKEHYKYIKDYFKDKGYKVKIKYVGSDSYSLNDDDMKIIVSWKHWRS